MGILDTASEVELIVCFALTSRKLVRMEGETLVPFTDPARAAAAKLENPVTGEPHYYELTEPDFARWVDDAMEERHNGMVGLLSYEILKALREQSRTTMNSLIPPGRDCPGLLFDFKQLMKIWDDIDDLAVHKHKLKRNVVVDRLSFGVWTGERNQAASRAAEPNIIIRLTRPSTAAGKEEPIGRKVIEEIAGFAREALLQDSVGVRARTAGANWHFFLVPGDLNGKAEKSISLFSGTRAAAEHVVHSLPAVLSNSQLADRDFTFEIRPVERDGVEPGHAVVARHAGSSALRDLLCGVFQSCAKLNQGVEPGTGIEHHYFLPVAHNCPTDLLAYDDLKCDQPGSACHRWSVRYRLLPADVTPLSLRGCHCGDTRHPQVGNGRRDKASRYVTVQMECCNVDGCDLKGSTRDFALCPTRTGDAVPRDWLNRNWALDWLDDL